MKAGIVRFPGSNCDEDAYHAIADHLGQEAVYLWHKDHVYEYTLDKSKVEKIGHGCYFESSKLGEIVRVKNDYHDYTIEDYDKLYITWATNLLPEEFNLEDVNYKRGNFSAGSNASRDEAA